MRIRKPQNYLKLANWSTKIRKPQVPYPKIRNNRVNFDLLFSLCTVAMKCTRRVVWYCWNVDGHFVKKAPINDWENYFDFVKIMATSLGSFLKNVHIKLKIFFLLIHKILFFSFLKFARVQILAFKINKSIVRFVKFVFFFKHDLTVHSSIFKFILKTI